MAIKDVFRFSASLFSRMIPFERLKPDFENEISASKIKSPKELKRAEESAIGNEIAGR